MKLSSTRLFPPGWLSTITLLLLLFGVAVTASAQTTPQYSTPANSSGSNSFPLNSATNKIQLQYQAGEFTGAFNGLITRVYLQRSSTTTSQSTFTNLTISMAQSATWPTTTTAYYTPMTLCYTATTTIFPAGAADEWIGITLNTPFTYDPTQHLIVIVCQEGYSTGISLRNVSTAPAPRRMWASGGCSTTAPSGNGSERYNFGFDLISPGPMAYSSSTTTQNNTTPVGTGTFNAEIIGVPVAVTGSTSPISATSFTFNTTGSTSTANMTAAKVFFTGSNPAFAATNQFGATVNNPSGSFTVNGSQVLGPGTNYFWLAYDVATNATVSHVLDAQCTGLTAGGIPRVPTVTNPAGSRSIIEMLNGLYTINPTGSGNRNFTSFTNAVAAMSAVGISGPVTFQVAAATYTEQVTIPVIPGTSATNTITFDGGTGNAATRIVTYSTPNANDYVMQLNGADYIRLRNLTIRGTGATNGWALHLTNQADYNEITNCDLELPLTSTSSAHYVVLFGAPTSATSYGNWANHNLIQYCNIRGGYYGMRLNGSGSTSTTIGINNRILNNNITDFYYYGMYTYYQVAMKVKHNRIIHRSGLTGTGYGIFSYYSNEGPEFMYNYVMANTYPCYIFYANSARSTTSIRGLIANNMFIGSSPSSTSYGIYVSYPRWTDIVYNSANLLTPSTGYGIYNTGTSTAYDAKFINNFVAYQGTGTFYAIYNSTATDMSVFDYNAWWSNSTVAPIFRWNTTQYSSLGALQAAIPAQHQNSLWNANPFFISNTDLHARSMALYQAGLAFPVVTDDYDGDLRGLNPCIGADEFPQPPPEFDLAVQKVRLNYADGTFVRKEGAAQHQVNVVLQNAGLSTDPTNFTVVYKIGSLPANSGDGVAQVFNPVWVNGKSVITFSQKITGLIPSAGLTVFARAFWGQDQNATNNSASDTRRIEGVKIQGAENFNTMLAPGFTEDPGFLDYDWVVNNGNGPATWRVGTGVGTSGTNALEYPGDTQPANDWVFSPAMDLATEQSYRFAAVLRSVSGAAQRIELAYGLSPDPGSMTTFATFANFTNTTFMSAKQLAGGLDPYFNTPSISGPYYLGIKVTSNAGAGSVVIDDIVLDDNPSPPPKIAFGVAGDPLNTFIDNSTKKLLFQANYKAPGLISRTYQVASMTNIYGTNGDFLWDVESTTPWISLTKATPEPTQQGFNFAPPRPRQFQDFTLTINPNGLAPGLHVGQLVFYGILFNDDFPPPTSGLIATNEPLTIDVELRIVNSGTKSGTQFEETTLNSLSSGNTYNFVASGTGTPIASVDVTSGSITSMTIRVYPYQLPQNLARMLYVKRYWQITTTGGGWWTANITFPYTDQEAVMIADRNQLHGVRQMVALGQWEDPIVGTSSASDPGMNLVKVFDLDPMNSTGNIALAQSYMMGKPGDALPQAFELEQNYPNPFNPSTTVSFSVAEERPVRIVVYNGLGMEIGELINDILPAGRYSVDFDASGLPSGTYMYRMMSGDFVQSRQMVLSK
jgi:hypothetical protein